MRTLPPAGHGYASTLHYAFTGAQPQYCGYCPYYTDNTSGSDAFSARG